jgi:5-methylcytosine-specific restriction endonuclease McrA
VRDVLEHPGWCRPNQSNRHTVRIYADPTHLTERLTYSMPTKANLVAHLHWRADVTGYTLARAGSSSKSSISTRTCYGKTWRAKGQILATTHPTCSICNEPATEVDHVLPKRLGGSDLDYNLQSLCLRCHARKTGREAGFGSNLRG